MKERIFWSYELLWAVEHNHVDLVEDLIEIVDVNVKRKWDLATPLIVAASMKNLQMMELLLKHKARVNAADKYGTFAIHHSAAKGHLEGVKLLMSKRTLVSVENRFHKTPLMYAAENGHYEIVEYLLSQGVNMQYQGHSDIVTLLVHSGDPSRDRSDELNHALQSALPRGQLNICRLLLSHGADPNYHGKNYMNPIFLAVYEENEDLVSLLISHGADVNVRDYEGYTPLMRAVSFDNVEVTKALVAGGLNKHRRRITNGVSGISSVL
ncbi:hypothetical protein Aperf_G00000001399 [Anoplocephala perfoliata]